MESHVGQAKARKILRVFVLARYRNLFLQRILSPDKMVNRCLSAAESPSYLRDYLLLPTKLEHLDLLSVCFLCSLLLLVAPIRTSRQKIGLYFFRINGHFFYFVLSTSPTRGSLCAKTSYIYMTSRGSGSCLELPEGGELP